MIPSRVLSTVVVTFFTFIALSASLTAQTVSPSRDEMVSKGSSQVCVRNTIFGAQPAWLGSRASVGGAVLAPCEPTVTNADEDGVSRIEVRSALSGMSINLTFDDAGMTSAGMTAADIASVHSACAYAAGQFTNNFRDNIHVNITVTAVPGTSTLGSSNTALLIDLPYSTVRGAAAADATTGDDSAILSAAGSMPPSDPIATPHAYSVTTAQAKALGLIADDLNPDGTFTFGAGFSYAYDPINRAVSSRFDFVGIAMHEFSEILGRIGLMGASFTGTPNYMQFDLFHFTGAGVRGLHNGAGRYFSVDNGTTLLKAFNNASSRGGDLQDWASGTNDSYNAFTSAGVTNDLSSVDKRNLDAIGYNYAAIVTAGSVPVAGRVVTPNGNGLVNAVVTISDSAGNAQSLITGPFGYFHFDEVAAGENYTLTVRSKRFTFAPNLIAINDAVEDLLITAQ